MVQNLVSKLSSMRLATYEAEWGRLGGSAAKVTRPAVASLYVWQVSLSSAWYETLAYTEAMVRDAVDQALRTWNVSRGRSEDWLEDAPRPLQGRVQKAALDARRNAGQAALRRGPQHPRATQPVSLDDRVAQLTFGNLVHLFPVTPPSQRALRGTGRTGQENLWLFALKDAFPLLGPQAVRGWAHYLPSGLPTAVEDGYSVGLALERLRRLRNRVGHHEQTFEVGHLRRLKDVHLLLSAIHAEAAEDVQTLDRVRRTLAMRPSP